MGKGIISGGDIGAASAAMRDKNYEKAYNLYREIIERGGAPPSELIAYKRIAWFYENGIGVEKNIDFSDQMKARAAQIENSIFGQNT
ncbi:hypothetical protein [Arenicella chitinivorans]|uniref:hypothetical protein n=1 Tax=Arenicella chitinivorans TaxID=1329800 RepID=UPI0016776CAD|nr:hypothetical protein [Arenicella chitinivorans]